ncbi:D-glycero-beta-D-manno-heptose 1,7-bisphosphate 7-phosphatase [Hallella absiana]|uniref:D-glycero-beta-D-manno-heptose 1,7-bisphosphate 7-phosphatase n=1 Tax=Hallella absiana TaxID=2925336 RepID=UPI0021C7A5C7|nr:D-glycero-beta-D-manno-heptose 1,7-bisphosphate 7-phosphatase [Hallella absiana]
MKTIIMAGGRGTRIAELFPNIPKPLIPVDGMPILEREIRSLAQQGFKDIILTVGYLADKIISYFGDGSKLGVKIEYFVEKTPLGNAGALFRLRDKIGDEPFLLLNADAAFDVDFNRMIAYHQQHGGLVTLFTHPNSHPYDSGLIIADKDGKVERWLSKEDERPLWYDNRVNAGLHVIDPKILDLSIKNLELREDELRTQDIVFDNGAHGLSSKNQVLSSKVDLDRQLLKPLCGTGEMFCYDSPEYVKDMGTPERFHQVEADFKAGIVGAKNLNHQQKAIFLDRDGTINKYVGFLRKIDDFELIDGAAEAIKKINASGYLAIVVTNQPVIARGEVSWDELYEIHRKMQTLLGQQGAYLDGIYICPHHPDKGFAGERPEYKIACDCRKPKPGLLLRAAKDFNIDLSQSYMIGDDNRDVLAGTSAGCKDNAFIQTNKPNALLVAVTSIINQ